MKWGHCRVRRLKRQRLRPLASVKTPGELPQNWLWGPQLNKVMGSWKMHSEGCACTPFWLTSCHGDRWKQKVEKLDWIPVLLFLSFFFFFFNSGLPEDNFGELWDRSRQSGMQDPWEGQKELGLVQWRAVIPLLSSCENVSKSLFFKFIRSVYWEQDQLELAEMLGVLLSVWSLCWATCQHLSSFHCFIYDAEKGIMETVGTMIVNILGSGRSVGAPCEDMRE